MQIPEDLGFHEIPTEEEILKGKQWVLDGVAT
jgi:hypothetical protein